MRRRRGAPPYIYITDKVEQLMADMGSFEESDFRSFAVSHVSGNGDGWRVDFYVNGEHCGHGQYQTSEQADDAGVEFMFGGAGGVES